MFEKIRKRDNRVVPFDQNKITQALLRAGNATSEYGEDTSMQLCSAIMTLAATRIKQEIPTVEMVQDIAEEVLLYSRYKATAKAYILYRDQHAKLRALSDQMTVDLIDQYLDRLDWQVKENSNMSYSLQGLNNYLSSETSKTYWLNKIYSPGIKQAHQSGDFHLHDLGQLSVYCVGWDLYDLLLSGFQGASGKIESAPPRHLRSALGQIVNFFYTLQGEAAGAQAFSSFDTLLAPFIRHDNLSYAEVKQALQEFVFNLNVPTRVGFQTPFTNLTMDLVVPKAYADQPVVIGGLPQDSNYQEYQAEMDLLNQAFLEVMMAGDAKGRVFTFPIPTYNITADFDWDNPKLDALWAATAKYGIPYFANFVNSDLSPDDARSMCCRLRLDTRELTKRGGGLFGANPLTGSVGVVTINLPKLAHTSSDEKSFLEGLDKLMLMAKESLEVKRKVLERLTENGLYPYTKYYLRDIQSRTGNYWQNHFSTIGLVGMNEACANLLETSIASAEGQAFAERTLDTMRERLAQFRMETGHLYNLEATPAEGTAYRLAQLDKRNHPEIVVANENEFQNGAAPFYTNSTHLPVNYTDDPFEALALQDGLQTRYTGGTVLHFFAGERIDDPASVREFVRKVCATHHLPYFTLTPTFSVCPSHGYQNGEHFHCPQCQTPCEVYSRVVGYLRPVAQWNNGKQAEFDQRQTYAVEKSTTPSAKTA